LGYNLKKKNILVLYDYYFPGYKAGGPIRTLANIVDTLGDEFQFKIVTSDRDLGDLKSYVTVKSDSWNRIGKAAVYYISIEMMSLRELKRIICSTGYDVIYLNSFFSFHFTIKLLLLRMLRLIPDRPIIIAPRGEFSSGALRLKRLKKRVYIMVAKLFRLYRGTVWQVSSKYEEDDLRCWFGKEAQVVIAPDLPPILTSHARPKVLKTKKENYLEIIFLSRISRKKNLEVALNTLKRIKGKVVFDIYGPIEDSVYWEECQKIVCRLPKNIEVRYCGCVKHENVVSVMRKYHFFFFPTLGENFGHVILESFNAGCPVLISDQTPWRGLEKIGVGWELPLDTPELFHEILQRCVNMGGREYMQLSERALMYGRQVAQDEKVIDQNRELFLRTISNETI
jgi:glycosyltransferase involved in cell wall biosynthesis